jgi:hypothetical protein
VSVLQQFITPSADFLSFFFFEAVSLYITQAGLKPVILLPWATRPLGLQLCTTTAGFYLQVFQFIVCRLHNSVIFNSHSLSILHFTRHFQLSV